MTSYYSHLASEALLHITGPDALTFLQGQVTCDTRALDNGQALHGAYCTPQGRVVCDFLLCTLAGDHHALRMRGDIRTESAATFGKYIIFSKAELDAERNDWQVLACWGDDAAPALREIFGTAPDTALTVSKGEGFALIQIDQNGHQFECLVDATRHPDSLRLLAERLQAAPETDWQALQIARGIGRIEAATSGEFVPQMLNYDLTGHISFNKGCYTGQEVVARLHYRGKPKRRMYLARWQAETVAATGSAIYSEGGQQSVGNLVNAVATPESTVLGLVIATSTAVENGLQLETGDGPTLVVGELPYSLEAGE